MVSEKGWKKSGKAGRGGETTTNGCCGVFFWGGGCCCLVLSLDEEPPMFRSCLLGEARNSPFLDNGVADNGVQTIGAARG